MTITAGELAARLQTELLRGDAGISLADVGSLADAGPDRLAPYTDEQYLDQLKATRAGAVLFKRGKDTSNAPAGAALLICDDPEIAFLKAVRVFHPEQAREPGVHPRAVVEPGVEIGADVHIGPNVFIERGTRIGARCNILANATIGRDCVLGDECVINASVTLYHGVKLGHRVLLHSGVVIGADGFGFKFRGGKHIKVPHVGWVEIGDDVEVGANSCIDRGMLGPTVIGAGTKIDNLVQIGHNNEVGKHCILCGQAALAGSCKLDDYVMLGGNVGLADHCHMGKGAKAGAKSGISGDIPPGSEVWGLFAREKREVFRSYAALRHLPELVLRVKELEGKMKGK